MTGTTCGVGTAYPSGHMSSPHFFLVLEGPCCSCCQIACVLSSVLWCPRKTTFYWLDSWTTVVVGDPFQDILQAFLMSDSLLQVTLVVYGPLQGKLVQPFPLSPLSLFETQHAPQMSLFTHRTDYLLPCSRHIYSWNNA